MARFALGVEYAGSDFCGWQTQPSGCGVQNALESALSVIAVEPISIVCAGRTDTGVHASAQVVHFDCDVPRPLSAWVRGVNAQLPESVAVRWAQEVDIDFHARFSATARHYRYLLLNRSTRSALYAQRAGWYHSELSLSAMQAAAALLEGEHDFSSFRAAECQAASPVRNLQVMRVTQNQNWFVFDLVGNAFLHHMVRNIVGALVYVGNGKLNYDDFVRLLHARNRRLAPPTFSAAGLYLCGVDYPANWSLPNDGRIVNPVDIPLL